MSITTPVFMAPRGQDECPPGPKMNAPRPPLGKKNAHQGAPQRFATINDRVHHKYIFLKISFHDQSARFTERVSKY